MLNEKDIFISIIIATYNRANILKETLENFSIIDSIDIHYELIIVDNNSVDNTKEIVEKYFDRLPVVYVFEKNQGKNYALNTALNVVTGDIIVFTDDDVTVYKHWFNEIINVCSRWPDINIFGGRVVPIFPHLANQKIVHSTFSDFMFTNHCPVTQEGICLESYPVGANCWVRKRLIESGEKFNVEMGPTGKGRISGGEIEFFHRMVLRGEKIVFAPSAIVGHRIQQSQFKIKYLIKRSIAGGRGWVRIRDPFRGCKFLFGAPRFLYRLVALAVITIPFRFVMGLNYLEPLMRLFEYIGCIQEYRLNSRNLR